MSPREETPPSKSDPSRAAEARGPAGDRRSSSALILRAVLIGIALVSLAAIAWLNRQVIVLFFGAIVIAVIFRSCGRLIRRVLPVSDRVAVLIGVLLLVAIVAGGSWLFGQKVAAQFSELREQLPRALDVASEHLSRLPGGETVVSGLQQQSSDGMLAKFGLAAQALLGGIANLLLILFAALYLALDPMLYRRGIIRLFPRRERPKLEGAAGAVGDALTKWMHAQLMLMLAVGTLTGIGLALVGVPLAMALAVIIGVLEFIPLLGPILGAVPGILLALSEGPDVAVYALLVYVGVQQLENNVLTPLVQKHAVELPPVVGLFAIVVGGIMFGLAGVVFATPLAVVVLVLTRKLYIEGTLER